MKKTMSKPYDELVDHLIDFHPNLRRNRKAFSDFIIDTIIGDFMKDPKIAGDHELRKSKAKDIYKQLMASWEKQFEEENNGKSD